MHINVHLSDALILLQKILPKIFQVSRPRGKQNRHLMIESLACPFQL